MSVRQLTTEEITEIAVAAALAAVQAALGQPATPAEPVTPPTSDFVVWMRSTAPERAARKNRNRETLAPMLDAKRPGWRGAKNRDAIWTAAKADKRLPAIKN